MEYLPTMTPFSREDVGKLRKQGRYEDPAMGGGEVRCVSGGIRGAGWCAAR